MSREPITGPSVWTADDLQRDPSWIYTLDASHLQELGQDRPLSSPVTTLLDRISDELEHGRGVARLRGLPIDRYSENELRRIFWTIGCHIGTPLFQNRSGEIMGEVRDETHDAAPASRPPIPARSNHPAPARARPDRCGSTPTVATSSPCSVPAMASPGACRSSPASPPSTTRSSAAAPTCSTSCSPTTGTPAPADEDGAFAEPVFALPVFGMRDGQITSQYSRTYVEQAQEYGSVPRLRATQNEALDLLAEVAEHTCLHAPFEPGDIQFLNNHVVYHGRTAYQDDAERGQSRLLLRLWLAVPNSRPLPEGFDVLWGAIHRALCAAGLSRRMGGGALPNYGSIAWIRSSSADSVKGLRTNGRPAPARSAASGLPDMSSTGIPDPSARVSRSWPSPPGSEQSKRMRFTRFSRRTSTASDSFAA